MGADRPRMTRPGGLPTTMLVDPFKPTEIERGLADRETVPADSESGPRTARGTEGPPPGRFRVGDEVARGGMGRVVVARDERLGRSVAIKEALDTDDTTLRRFEREVQITARLQHPSIVPLYDAGRWPSGHPYYVMRLVSGRPLHERIQEAGSLRERLSLVPSFLAAADAVGFAHRHGVVHRDLKPANVLVGEHGETVVIDWGLAKVLGESEAESDGESDASEAVDAPASDVEGMRGGPHQTRAGAVLGTPGYMPPEQAAGDPVGPASDVYALGATLYHLLAGGPPTTASGPITAIAQVLSGPPPPLAQRAPGTPSELLAIVDKAMAADASARYPDGSALAADLRRFLTGQLVAAHRYSARDRLRRFARRHRAALLVGGLAALILVTTVVIGLGRIVSARQRTERARADAAAGWRSAEEARRRAAERAGDLLLARAEALLDADPTSAAVLAARLPLDSTQWARARAILGAARARGIARSLPGRRDVVRLLELDPAGRRLLSADRRGAVEVHDLDRLHSRQIAGGEMVTGAVWAEGGGSVAIASGERLYVMDLETDERRAIPIAAPVVALVAPADASFLAWRDRDGELALAAPPAWKPVRLGQVGRERGWLRTSRDGQWLATWSSEEPLRLWRRDRRGPVMTSRPGCDAVFHASSQRLAVACPKEVTEWRVNDARLERIGRWPRVILMALAAYGGDQLFDLTARGEVIALYPNGSMETLATLRTTLMPHVTPAGLALSSGSEAITLIEQFWIHTLRAPTARVARVAEAGRNRLAVGTLDGRILLFDLEHVRPRRAAIVRGASRVLWVQAGSALVARSSGEIDKYDLATGEVRPISTLQGYIDRSHSAPGGEVVIISSIAGEVAAVRPSDAAFELLADHGAALAAVTGPDRMVWELDRTLWEKRVFSGEPARKVATWKARAMAVAAQSGWLAGALGDGTLWRRAPGSAATEELSTGRPLTPALAVGADGTVYAAIDGEVWRWRGELERFASLPGAISDMALDPDLGLSVATIDGSAHLVSLADGAVRTTPLPPAISPVELSQRGARAAAQNTSGHPVAIDLAGARSDLLTQRWSMNVAVSADGTATAALVSNGELFVFSHDLPRAPAELRAWLAKTTNASVNDRGAVVWP
jgi:eukaryotic-like serine/threonine-protein kinase